MNKNKFYKIIYNIIPYLEVIEKNKLLEKKYNQISNKEYQLNLNISKTNEFLEELKEYQEKELNRRNLIEDKGKSMLFIITLSTTFLLGNMNFIYQFYNKFNPLLIILLIIGLIYLILSVICAINVVKIKPQHGVYLFDKYNIEHTTKNILEKNKIITKNIDEIEGNLKITEIIKSIELNECLILQKSNSLDCTFSLIERGIICIAFYFISLILNKYFQEIINIIIQICNTIPI